MIDGPIAPRFSGLSFDELAKLRDITRDISDRAVESLIQYRDTNTGGFFHVLDADAPGERNEPGDLSQASTATVVNFLVRTGRWPELAGEGAEPAQRLLDEVLTSDEWSSAQLPGDNPFTVGFKLEMAAVLLDVGAEATPAQLQLCASKLEKLRAALELGEGRVRISVPPPEKSELPNSYLTQLVMRVLYDWDRRALHSSQRWLTDALRQRSWGEAVASANREVALLQADPLAADVFELGYAVLIAAAFPPPDMPPTERHLLRHALTNFFASQRVDGSWPRGRRLFNYPTYGNAYAFDYEFLGQLLSTFPQSSQVLLSFLPQFQKAIDRLSREAVALPDGGIGWASGHHRQMHYPESWSTASCFDVCHRIDRLVASAVTDTILQDLGERPVGRTAARRTNEFDKLLDAPIVKPDGTRGSLKAVLREKLIDPIRAQLPALDDGKPLRPGTRLSAILYGPPGTKKTGYTAAISREIGWEMVTIDPSHLLRSGFDGIVVEVNRLFRMLMYAERVVVFFDEIDELVRSRSGPADEAASRFLTTSMLPRLGRLRETQRLMFLIATNHLEIFDAAIARPGRIDLVIPVMPPTASEKLKHWPAVDGALDRHGLGADEDQLGRIEDLTYDELGSVAQSLVDAPDKHAFITRLEAAAKRGTLTQGVDGAKTWAELISAQRDKIRID